MHLCRSRVRPAVLGLAIDVGLVGLSLGIAAWRTRGAEALRVEAANRALAGEELAVIDESLAFLEMMSINRRVELDGGRLGRWGRRRLDALRKAGAGKMEIVAASEKYIIDLERMQQIAEARQYQGIVGIKQPAHYEIRFLCLEAEIWLNEERAR